MTPDAGEEHLHYPHADNYSTGVWLILKGFTSMNAFGEEGPGLAGGQNSLHIPSLHAVIGNGSKRGKWDHTSKLRYPAPMQQDRNYALQTLSLAAR